MVFTYDHVEILLIYEFCFAQVNTLDHFLH